MSTKKKYGVDPRAKAAAECYIALESAQSSIRILIGVPDAMRAARYTTDESKDKTLQVQVRREVERIKRDNVDPAPMLVIGVGCRLYLVTETVRYRENIATLEAELGMSSLLSCDVIIVVVFVFFVLLFNR